MIKYHTEKYQIPRVFVTKFSTDLHNKDLDLLTYFLILIAPGATLNLTICRTPERDQI